MIQDIDKASTSQVYPIGFGLKRRKNVFHYAYAGSTLAPGMGAKIKNPQEVSQTVLGAAASAGSRSIVLGLDNTDGPTYNGLLPANYLKGGQVVVFAALGTFVRQILSNTAVTVNGGIAYFTVTLDAPIPVAVAVTDVAEAIASPYACVVDAAHTKLGTGFAATIGVPTVAAVSGQFLWLATAGPWWVSPHAQVGVADSDKMAFFVGDGSLGQGKEVSPGGVDAGIIEQHAGFVLANDKGSGQGAPFIMLNIDPTFDIVG